MLGDRGVARVALGRLFFNIYQKHPDISDTPFPSERSSIYRSEISPFHIPIDGVIIGKHPLVSKFMKGFFVYVPLTQNIL